MSRLFICSVIIALCSQADGQDAADAYPPHEYITSGPRHHWFGYYDKLQFDPEGRYVLGMRVPFESRSPQPDDVITVGMVDLHDNDRWIDLGESRAWNWQQGCSIILSAGKPTWTKFAR